jgi:hypothetical protein
MTIRAAQSRQLTLPIARGPQRRRSVRSGEQHWLGDNVIVRHGSLDELAATVPVFRRQPLALTSVDGTRSTLNWTRDLVIRRGRSPLEDDLPVSVVSTSYRLVQHTEVVRLARRALDKAGIPVNEVSADVVLTTHGERMALRVTLPPEYDFDPGDGHTIALRFECFNSVDGSLKFMAILEWLRLVCANGLLVGVTRSSVRRHDRFLSMDELEGVLAEGLSMARLERQKYADWLTSTVDARPFKEWIDRDVAKTWGRKAAARVHYIVRTGHDGEFAERFERARPSERLMRDLGPVPGSPAGANDAFAISQALSYVATHRADLHDRIAWMHQIPDLMSRLLAA